MAFNLKRAVRILMGMLEEKDHITAEHCRNVARLSVQLGQECGLKTRQLEELEIGALLHDADKLNVPDQLFDKLRSGSRLTQEDLRILTEHSDLEGRFPFEGELPKVVQQCQKLHHENYDGTGAPNGLKADQIPFPVRILQVADTYDALTLNLPGRRGQSKKQALLSLKQGAGSTLDPELVTKFIRMTIKSRDKSA